GGRCEARQRRRPPRVWYGRDARDICVVPQMYNARGFKCDLEPYPTLRAICAHLESLPAFAKATPETQPDAR
ncbi:MAG: hypothetical protein ACRETD_13245, partial [Steroidobacteraceae bacterium]